MDCHALDRATLPTLILALMVENPGMDVWQIATIVEKMAGQRVNAEDMQTIGAISGRAESRFKRRADADGSA